jgi:hypothetical protein
LNHLKKGAFFEDILGLYIDGYIDLVITSYYNQKLLLYTTNGEIFGAIFSYFILYSSVPIIPALLIWISFKNKQDLSD